MKWYERYFFYITYIVYILYIIIFFGIWSKAPEYLSTINYWRQLFIGILLIYYFHPFSKTVFTEFHRKLAFTSGLFLIGTSILHEVFNFVKTKYVYTRQKISDLL